MIRLFFYVEGQTEQGYVTKVLTPYLAQFGVYVAGAILTASGRRHGKTFRGGGHSYAKMRRDLTARLKEHSQPDVRFTTMFDLYALHHDWPGYDEAETHRQQPHERARKLEAALAADLGDERLIPHIQLHEFETILLCDPEVFKLTYENADTPVKHLAEMVARDGPPEAINDGEATAPSKRIDGLFPGYAAAKTSIGVDLASCVELVKVRGLCPHFDEWVGRLEGLGTRRGEMK
jgi:Domain of unknown function (DUF4276)